MTALRISNGYTSNNLDFDVEVEKNSDASNRQVIAVMDRFYPANADESGDPAYYGYIARDGSWYIQKIISESEYLYVFGSSDYTGAWSDRDLLTYQLYNLAFPSEV